MSERMWAYWLALCIYLVFATWLGSALCAWWAAGRAALDKLLQPDPDVSAGQRLEPHKCSILVADGQLQPDDEIARQWVADFGAPVVWSYRSPL